MALIRCVAKASIVILSFVVVLQSSSTLVAMPFDVTAITTGSGGTAAGTSNGVGFVLSPTLVASLSVTNESYTGFSNPAFHNPSMANSDILHVGRESFTLNFDQTLKSALVYLTDNPPTPDGELDFGITPTVVSGNINVNGTKFGPGATNGGLVRLDNINSAVLSHKATGAAGGVNFAIFVTAVPEPSSVFAVAACSASLFLFRLPRRCTPWWRNYLKRYHYHQEEWCLSCLAKKAVAE